MADESRSNYQSSDAESQAAEESYSALIDSIKRNMDPKSNTVLIVDDAMAIRKKVARDVRAFAPNLVIYEAANGKEALEKLVEIMATHVKDPLFIVLDLNMPVMDGWAVIKHLKQEYEAQGKTTGIPIIVLSSTSGEKNVALFIKKTVHDGKSGYEPLITVAKETCADRTRYDAAGEKGLLVWLRHFTKS